MEIARWGTCDIITCWSPEGDEQTTEFPELQWWAEHQKNCHKLKRLWAVEKLGTGQNQVNVTKGWPQSSQLAVSGKTICEISWTYLTLATIFLSAYISNPPRIKRSEEKSRGPGILQVRERSFYSQRLLKIECQFS
jgi:hypothetical protein